jgi:hypothetical protein
MMVGQQADAMANPEHLATLKEGAACGDSRLEYPAQQSPAMSPPLEDDET